MTPYQLAPTRVIGPGAYNRDMVVIDEHTGTQFDAPAAFRAAARLRSARCRADGQHHRR